MLKLIREPRAGSYPEAEVSRFLTEQGLFRNFFRLAGDVTLDDNGGSVLALALEYRRDQGDVWRYVRHHLDRFLDEARLRPAAETRDTLAQVHAAPLAVLATLGWRLGELHLALGKGGGSFEPIPVAAGKPAEWKNRVLDDMDKALAYVAEHLATIPESDIAQVSELTSEPEVLRQHIQDLPVEDFGGLMCRYHGDLHLGRVLIAEDDVLLTEFSADPGIISAQGDPRECPLRDVAELLRSIDRAVQRTLQGFSDLSAGDQAILREFALDWQKRAEEALLEAYLATTSDSHLYGLRREARAVIELFLLGKLAHEIRHGKPDIEDDRIVAIRGLLSHLAKSGATSRKSPK